MATRFKALVSFVFLKSAVGAFIVALTIFLIFRKRREVMSASKDADSEQNSDLKLQFSAKLETICRFSDFPRNGPSKVLDFLYLGGMGEAQNIPQLTELGITHIVNCASGYISTGPGFYGDNFKYMGFDAEDEWGYNIMQHFNDTFSFIEDARISGGKVFVHCQMGVNRSGALVTGYVMIHNDIGPLSAARLVKKARKLVLTNEDFQHQLIQLASERDMLQHDMNELQVGANI